MSLTAIKCSTMIRYIHLQQLQVEFIRILCTQLSIDFMETVCRILSASNKQENYGDEVTSLHECYLLGLC